MAQGAANLETDEVLAHLTQRFATYLQVPPEDVDTHTPLVAQNVDSMALTEMGADVEATYGIAVPIAALFEGGSLETLAMEICVAHAEGRTSLEPATNNDAPQAPHVALSLWLGGAHSRSVTTHGALLDLAHEIEAAGSRALWLQERHFDPSQSLFGCPEVLAASLASHTTTIQIRGVLPLALHHPLRVAEQWASVDRISAGRVGLAFSADAAMSEFVLAPHAYASRSENLLRQVELVRALWRGESPNFAGASGDPHPVASMPRPVRNELPIWLLCADRDSFVEAAKHACNVVCDWQQLTRARLHENLLGYREAWQSAGHAGSGHVTLTTACCLEHSYEAAVSLVSSAYTTPGSTPTESALALGVLGSEADCAARIAELIDAGIDEIALQPVANISDVERILGQHRASERPHA